MIIKTLIIEDDPIAARWISKALSQSEKYQFETSAVLCMRTALNALQREAFGLILLDLHLPDSMDGTETFERLYALYPQVPLIVISADDDTELAERLLTLGALDYISKPVVEKTLFLNAVGLALVRHELLARLHTQVDLLKHHVRSFHWSAEQRQSAGQVIFAAELVSSSIPHLWRRDAAEAQKGMITLEGMILESISRLNKLLNDTTLDASVGQGAD